MEFETKLSLTLLIQVLIIGGDKSDKQPRETENNTKFYELREEAFKVHNNYFKMVSKAVYDAKKEKDSDI